MTGRSAALFLNQLSKRLHTQFESDQMDLCLSSMTPPSVTTHAGVLGFQHRRISWAYFSVHLAMAVVNSMPFLMMSLQSEIRLIIKYDHFICSHIVCQTFADSSFLNVNI